MRSAEFEPELVPTDWASTRVQARSGAREADPRPPRSVDALPGRERPTTRRDGSCFEFPRTTFLGRVVHTIEPAGQARPTAGSELSRQRRSDQPFVGKHRISIGLHNQSRSFGRPDRRSLATSLTDRRIVRILWHNSAFRIGQLHRDRESRVRSPCPVRSRRTRMGSFRRCSGCGDRPRLIS